MEAEERLLGTLFRWGPEGQVAEVPLDIFKGDDVFIGRDASWYACLDLTSHYRRALVLN